MINKRRLKRRILARARRVVLECEQTIIDIQYWNHINPSERPMDAEEFRVWRANAQKVIDQMERQEP